MHVHTHTNMFNKYVLKINKRQLPPLPQFRRTVAEPAVLMSWEEGQDRCQRVMTLKHDRTLDRTGTVWGVQPEALERFL